MRATMVNMEGRVTAKNLFVISEVPPFSREEPPYSAFLQQLHITVSDSDLSPSHLYSMFLSNLLVINLIARIISGLIGFFVHTGHS